MTASRDIPTKSFVIKDPVHGYIRIAAHERIVVDHPSLEAEQEFSAEQLAELGGDFA